MAVISFSREASKDEMGREIDRRGAVIDTLTEERDRLKEIVDGTGLATAAIAAERDRLAKQVDELQELFRIDGENHASVIRDLTNRHETRITKYAERIKELREANAELLASLASVLQACDEGRMVERGAGGMTIDAQIRRSVINGVPAWPIEEARALLDKYKATSTERPAMPSDSEIDALIERLSQFEGRDWETTVCYNGLRLEAAAFLAALRDDRDQYKTAFADGYDAAKDEYRARVRELEQKLERARVALRVGLELISEEKGWGTYPRMEGSEIYVDANVFEELASAALAEIGQRG